MTEGPADFERAMHEIYLRAKSEAGYNATIYLRMLYKKRGLGTARYLLDTHTVSEGYTHLYERGRLDLTVEALIVANQRWHHLFTTSQLDRARERLNQYGYNT